MAKRFKCRVKKINHVTGAFIHSYLISFLACTSQCSKLSHFFICLHVEEILSLRKPFGIHSACIFSAVTLKIRSRSRKFYQMFLSC